MAVGVIVVAAVALCGPTLWFREDGALAPPAPGTATDRRPVVGIEAATPSPAEGTAEPSERAGAEDALARPAQPKAGAVFRDCPTCPYLVVVPAGSFNMGSNDGRPDERPVHMVTIARSIAVGQREVTQGQWDACANRGACAPRPGGPDAPDAPVTNLTWFDTQAYLAWLSKTTGQRYRLPTEAEWEYAGRAGTKQSDWWGSEVGVGHADCSDCGSKPSGAPKPGGSYPANPFGLYDTAGNAAEWVQDCYAPSYKAAPTDGTAVERPDCPSRVLRGGSFVNDAHYVRSASRYRYEPSVPYYAHGFRVVSEVGQ